MCFFFLIKIVKDSYHFLMINVISIFIYYEGKYGNIEILKIKHNLRYQVETTPLNG